MIVFKNNQGQVFASNGQVLVGEDPGKTEHNLVYDGTNIKYNGTVRTFEMIKTACDDNTKNVFLTYQSRKYVPSVITSSSIYFDNSTVIDDHTTLYRVSINSSNVIEATSYDIGYTEIGDASVDADKTPSSKVKSFTTSTDVEWNLGDVEETITV